MMQSDNQNITIFEAKRRRLVGLAYRMTGSVADAEDILQQAWIRFAGQNLAAIDYPPRWLSTVVTRLCLDHLGSAQKRREEYVGAWLPDPLVQDAAPGAEQDWIVSEDVSIALFLTLDELSPEMRAAFILRDAFDYSFDEIAAVTGRSAVTCRQLVSRARRKLAGADTSLTVKPDQALPIVKAFWQASRQGDMQGLLELFAEDIELHMDGGGKVPAVLNVLKGAGRIANFYAGLARKRPGPVPPCPPLCRINAAPGLVSVEPGNVLQTTAFGIRNNRIFAIWTVRNPDKLRHLAAGS